MNGTLTRTIVPNNSGRGNIVLFCLYVSLFNIMLTFVGYLLPTYSVLKNSSDTDSLWNKEAHTFPYDISSKRNVIVWLEFGLTYLEAAVQRSNH